MASHDYIRYLTEKIVRYLDTSREERIKQRKERYREGWDRQWFGDIPFSLQMSWQHLKYLRKNRTSITPPVNVQNREKGGNVVSKKIAIEEGLTPVRNYLKNNGYEVVDLNQTTQVDDCDCCVISGIDEDMMNMQDMITEVPVINASGMSPEEVYQHLQERVGH